MAQPSQDAALREADAVLDLGLVARPAWPRRQHVDAVDATYLKSRDNHHVVSRALVVAVGVNKEGRREVLGIACGPAETEAFWTEFLRSLSARGLGGVRLVISDAHQGLKKAVAKVLAASWRAVGRISCVTRWATFRRSSMRWWQRSSARRSSRRAPRMR